jgi:parallel beta-helix repeat protein
VKSRVLARALPLVLVAAAILVPSVASADQIPVLYVNGAKGATCSDTGTGTQSLPYCTISAAVAVVTAGQTVSITPGLYAEHVTVASSGTPSAPITFTTSAAGFAVLSGATAGFTIAGQHDVVIDNFEIVSTSGAPAALVQNSSSLSFGGDEFLQRTAGQPALSLTGVTNSTFTHDTATAQGGTAISVDAASNGNTLSGATVQSAAVAVDLAGAHNTIADLFGAQNTVAGVEVSGAGDVITGSTLRSSAGAGVAVLAGASGTMVDDSTFSGNKDAITVSGAADTTLVNNSFSYTSEYAVVASSAATLTITNNTFSVDCAAVEIDGAPTDVTIENNLSWQDGEDPYTSGCVSGIVRGGLEVAASAIGGTTMDYNTVYDNAGTPYVWGTAYASLAAFQAASGQGLHDSALSSSELDSANSAAPGFPAKDSTGRVREDDPYYPNTGAGPIAYADRGATETVGVPAIKMVVSSNLTENTVSVNASGTASFSPILSYTFDFGDGTAPVTQTSAVLGHTYAAPGQYQIMVSATDTLNGTGSGGQYYMYGRAWNQAQPFPILDTATALGTSSHSPVGAGKTVTLDLASSSWMVPAIPSTSAISLDVTVSSPTASGSLTVYPNGASRPATPNLHFAKSAKVQNLITVQVRDGKVDFYNGSSGTVHITAAVEGMYDNSDVTYEPLTPKRVVSTSAGIGAKIARVKAHSTLVVPWSTLLPGALAANDATGAVLNVVVANESASTGSLTVYDPEQGKVTTPNLNWNTKQTVSATVALSLFGDHADFVNNSSGTIDIVVDLQGEFTQNPTPAGLYMALPSTRVLDKTTPANTPVTTMLTQIPGTMLKAVMLDVTVTNAKAGGYLSVSPTGVANTGTSQLHWAKGQTLSQMVIVPLGTARKISISNGSSGSTEIQVDLYGYFVGTTASWVQ